MISTEVLKKIAKDKEEENFGFRVFLKDHQGEEIDKLVRKYYKELYSKEFCDSCMNCCKEYRVELDASEEEAAAKVLGIDVKTLKKEYLHKKRGRGKDNKACVFLKDNKCLIEQAKPKSCDEYPHIQKDDFIFRLLFIIDNYSVCPLIYEVYERLKKHFRREFEAYYQIYRSKFHDKWTEPVNPQYAYLDRRMKQGYRYMFEEEFEKAVKTWESVFDDLMEEMKKEGVFTFKDFDLIFMGSQFVCCWIMDFEESVFKILKTIKNDEKKASYGRMLIRVNEDILEYIDSSDDLTVENAKIAIAKTYYILGNEEKGEELFRKYLEKDP